MEFKKLSKLQKGDKVAVLSPSFAAPAVFPHVHELGLKRLRDVFGLEPVEYPTTRKLDATGEERAKDLIFAFEDSNIKAVIATIGGDDQVTYIKNLPSEPFVGNPKPFFGFSDNTHFENFLWLNGVPSYYGGSLFTQIAFPGEINALTGSYLERAFFETGEVELETSDMFNEVNLDWDDPANLNRTSEFTENDGWVWSNTANAEGVSWCGCVESIDEMMRHGIEIPSLKHFEDMILVTETTEWMPPHDYVFRVFRAFGERGILERLQGIVVGRAKAWDIDNHTKRDERQLYRKKQRQTIENTVRQYNADIPIVQNLDIGHTEPQIPIPNGKRVRIDGENRKIFATF